jgi:four helix bundle protein
MTDNSEIKHKYDLEERTFKFAKEVRIFVKSLPFSTANQEDGKQLIRASGSVGANYIEANESLSKKRFYNENKNLSERSQRRCVLATVDFEYQPT